MVTCPDLTAPPFGLAAPGLGGASAVADVGGVNNMEYVANTNKFHFDLEEVSQACGLPAALYVPWVVTLTCSVALEQPLHIQIVPVAKTTVS